MRERKLRYALLTLRKQHQLLAQVVTEDVDANSAKQMFPFE